MLGHFFIHKSKSVYLKVWLIKFWFEILLWRDKTKLGQFLIFFKKIIHKSKSIYPIQDWLIQFWIVASCVEQYTFEKKLWFFCYTLYKSCRFLLKSIFLLISRWPYVNTNVLPQWCWGWWLYCLPQARCSS